MRLKLAAVALLVSQAGFAQNFPQWVNGIGSQGFSEAALGVAVDTNDNVYVGGFFSATTDFDPGVGVFELTPTIEDPYLARYTPAGALVWALHFAGRGKVTDVAVDNAGNLLVLGEYSDDLVIDSNLTLIQPGTSTDIFLAQFDLNGNLNWVFGVGGTGADVPQALAVDSLNNVVISGTIRISADLDPGPGVASVEANVGEDSFVARYDSTGAYQWGHLFEQQTPSGIAQSDSAHGLVVADNDDVLVAGLFEGQVDFGPVTVDATGTDAYIARISAAGAVLWVSSTQSTGLRTEHFAIGLDGVGNIITAGIYFGDTDFDPDPVAQTSGSSDNSLDAYIASYDANGDFRWVQFITGPGTDLVTDIQVRDDGTFTVAGQFGGTTDFDPGPTTDIRSAEAQFDAWYAHFDVNGGLVSAQHLPGVNASFAQDRAGIEAMATTADGDLVMAGSYRGSVDFNPGPGQLVRSPVSSNDGFLARFGPPPPELVFANSFETPLP